jgi:ribosome biogenesis GTPase / thiamine phosphate phosphatase
VLVRLFRFAEQPSCRFRPENQGLRMSTHSLLQLGWRPFHSQQLTLEELESVHPARVSSVHRSGSIVLSERGSHSVTIPPRVMEHLDRPVTVGDWVLVENAAPRVQRVVAAYGVITRVAAGTEHRVQAIAANLDTLFVVTSCNQDFNRSRLERYLAVAYEARVEPVIVLTKADLCAQPDDLVDQARLLASTLQVVAVNATSPTAATSLRPWVQPGQTVAFVGSSGVGKSTLVNRLIGHDSQATAGIREDDSRGRHTTTAREMFALAGGAWVIDTPGMRELKVGTVDSGLRTVFDNIEALASHCHFRDCRHESEVGCAVLAAIAAGQLDARRLANYHKLQREAAHSTLSTAARRERDRRFGRMAASAMQIKRRSKE